MRANEIAESSRSRLDQPRSSTYPDRPTQTFATRERSRSTARCVSLLGVVGLAALSILTPGCAHEFDTERPQVKRGSVGEEIYGVLCDRVGAQALREDMTGASFKNVCHKPVGGEFADKVDQSKLPSIDPQAVDESDNLVSTEKQKKDREKAVGRVEALARRRADLIRALDATFPGDRKVAIKDIDNEDPTKQCDAPKKSGEGLLVDQIADMLGRMGDLYNDGTIPQSTQSLARVVDAFKKSPEAHAAWSRISARQGYRPIETALGAARPMVAYPNLRDFANASLRLLAADSNPYELDPKRDGDGNRVPTPGPGNAAFNKLLEASHEELLAAKADPRLPNLAVTTDPSTGRVILSRPRDNLEMMSEILFASDPAFGGGNSRYIVRRDPRGYAMISGGQVPAPFVDADKDGLPDVDELGRFKTTNNSLAPSPFPFPGNVAEGTRDKDGRALAGSRLLYEYIDTSHTFAAQMMVDLKPLVNPDPNAKHETLMDLMGGMPVVMGPREPRSKQYGSKKVDFEGIRTKDSPMLDLVHAMGVILSDRTADTTLSLTRELFATKPKEMARLTGAMSAAFDIAQKHPEAKIPKTATFWDENLDTIVKIAKEPGLLEDLLRALASPDVQEIGNTIARYARFKDEVTYDQKDINGLPWNVTTKSKSELKTPVDNNAPKTGQNRSALYRFLGLINDTNGVTTCNKPGAKVHAKLAGISVTMPPIGSGYDECEVFKIENMARFYVDVIAEAWQYDPDTKPNKRGAMYLRNDTLRTGILGIGAATTDLLENSSGITGFVDTGNNKNLTPSPQWLNRLVFFDTKNDTSNPQTKLFIQDLQGDLMGSSVCPERVINDPMPSAPDASPDGKVHGLRNCAPGQHLQERGKNTIFVWEHFGFYRQLKPIVGAFAKHGREDLFVELSQAAYKHFPGADASPDECRLAGGAQCPRSGANSYEALLAEAFATDILPALSELAKALDQMPVKRCDAVDPTTKACTKTTTISGIDAAAAATRAAVDPDYAKTVLQLKDRRGNVTAKRNDGKTNPQVTPAYLLTQALSAIDDTFDAYEQQHPEDKGERRAGWRRARSQMVDQFMGTTGIKSNTTFSNPAIPKMTPVIVDMLRAQLYAHCPNSFAPPYEKCVWARDELAKKAEEVLGGPLMATGIDVMDAIRSDPEGRKETEKLLTYLLDAASKNDALASLLASANDMIQLLRDDENLVPLFHVIAQAMDASKKDPQGRVVEKSLVDAQMALLAKISGKYVDKDGKEICGKEIDPNQVLAVALGNLVTPIKNGDFKGQTPLEVIIDVIADVNRVDPTQPYEGTLDKADYASVSDNIVDFLTNKERGLEQFYEVIRQGTKF
jgi:hypothetical protein